MWAGPAVPRQVPAVCPPLRPLKCAAAALSAWGQDVGRNAAQGPLTALNPAPRAASGPANALLPTGGLESPSHPLVSRPDAREAAGSQTEVATSPDSPSKGPLHTPGAGCPTLCRKEPK